MQTRLRAEIRERESIIRSRGDSQFTVNDLESMPYLTAIIKASKNTLVGTTGSFADSPYNRNP